MEGLNCALQDAGKAAVDDDAVLMKELAGSDGVALASGGEGDVHPARETIFGIPYTLAMAHKDQCNCVIEIRVLCISVHRKLAPFNSERVNSLKLLVCGF